MKISIILLFTLLLLSLANAQYIFNVDVNIIPKTISAGENIIVNTNIKNLGLISDRINVKLSYEIQDENGKLIDGRSSTLTLQTSLSISEVFTLSKNIKSGKYDVIVKADYQGYKASDSDSFYVRENTFLVKLNRVLDYTPIIFIIIFFVIVIILIRWIIHHYYTRHRR